MNDEPVTLRFPGFPAIRGVGPVITAQDAEPATGMADALDAARDLGTEHGKSAASWVFDGNTPEETYRSILAGLNDGDPAVLDSIEPEFAGAREVMDELGLDYDLAETSEIDQIHDAYMDEARTAFSPEVERLARQHLA